MVRLVVGCHIPDQSIKSKLQVEQHQPDSQRASHLGERLIEGPPHEPGGARQVKTDWWLGTRRHLVRIEPSKPLRISAPRGFAFEPTVQLVDDVEDRDGDFTTFGLITQASSR